MPQRKVRRYRYKKSKKPILIVGFLVAVAAIVIVAYIIIGTNSPGDAYSSGTKVLFMTSMGNITIQLRNDKPITTSNFLNLTRQELYDGTIFHRVMAGYIIQGGLIQNANITPIPDEIGADNHNYNGTIAMAKTVQPNSATSSFFINVKDNNTTSFDATYTVFGRVIEGMDVVMKIASVETVDSPYMQGEKSFPSQEITLIKAMILP